MQLLDKRIDIDYIASLNNVSVRVEYDDLDTVTELILEKIVGEDNFTSEEADDDGNPQNKGVERFDPTAGSSFLMTGMAARPYLYNLYAKLDNGNPHYHFFDPAQRYFLYERDRTGLFTSF